LVGYRKGIQPVKTSAANLLEMVVYVSGWGSTPSTMWV